MSVIIPASRAFAWAHRWYLAAWMLARLPLAHLDSNSVGRLQYALMMTHRTHPRRSRDLWAAILQRNADTTPELPVELAAMATSIADDVSANSLLQQASQQTSNPHTLQAAERLLHVNQGLADGSLQATIGARIDSCSLPSDGQPLTLVPLSSGYLDLWHLWLAQVRRHIGGRVLVIAMDDAALTATQCQPAVHTIDMREFFAWNKEGSIHPRSRGVLWLLRVLVLRDLVHRGHTTLVLDLDALPVGDLGPMLAGLPGADVVAQKDHSLPMDVNRQLGFVLCCGFMLWRPTAAALALLHRFAAETAIERDDQMALNHILARDGVTGRTQQSTHMSFRSAGAHFVCPDPSLVSRTLHSGTVVRHFQQEGNSITALREALGLGKTAIMARRGAE